MKFAPSWSEIVCVLLLAALALACYRHPLSDDFDRYIYESIVRARSQPIGQVYELVKHESPRAESSSIMDSSAHLLEILPFYKIRPVYLEAIAILGRWLPLQSAINLISAVCFFAIGLVVLAWTRAAIATFLVMLCYPILSLGRTGTPDAPAALLAIAALWLCDRKGAVWVPIALLLLSLGVRTDNVVLLVAAVGWMAIEKKISIPVAGAIALIGAGMVVGIQHFAHNYGWAVLFRTSFIGGRARDVVGLAVTPREYLAQCARGAYSLFPQLALWVLLGVLAWYRRASSLLIVAGIAAVAHFVMFPSGEVRYFLWACVIAAVALVNSYQSVGRTRSFTTPR